MIHLQSFLLTKELATQLRLKEQYFVLLIPKKLVENYEILSSELSFDLVFENNRISLIGPESSQRETKTPDVFPT